MDPRLIQILKKEEEPVLCVQAKTGKKKKLSFRALHDNNPDFYNNPSSSWTFFLPSARVHVLQSQLNDQANTRLQYHGEDDVSSTGETNGHKTNFGNRYEEIALLSAKSKLDLIKDHTGRLNKILASETIDLEEAAEVLGNSTSDASLVNKSFIEDALKLGDEEAKAFSRELVDRTHEMVKSSTSLIDNSVFQDEMLHSLVNQSNGTVVQHMTRTYLRCVSFLLFYNKKILNSSHPNRVRIGFKKKYRKYYNKLLPHLHHDDVVLERVFHSGMQAISPQQIHTFATGFLLHDIGKAKNIDYYEGSEGYDREKVVDHVRQGYKAILNKTDYPMEVSMITGYHHEYYGHPSGYGFFRAELKRHYQTHPKHHVDYVIGYHTHNVLSFQTMSFFPAKILEIVDVFDALTDPNRRYREPLDSNGALEVMREQFVEEELKLDPILFDLYSEYQLNSA